MRLQRNLMKLFENSLEDPKSSKIRGRNRFDEEDGGWIDKNVECCEIRSEELAAWMISG